VRDAAVPRWRLAGAHVEGGEPLAETARRAVREQTHVERFELLEPHLAVQQDLGTCDGVETRHVDHVFAAVTDPLTDVGPGPVDGVAASWFAVDGLPRDIDPGVRLHLSQAVRAAADL